MENINKQTPVGEIARYAPQTIRLFKRLGFDFCCGGAKPLEDACDEVRLDSDAVLKLVQEVISGPAAENGKDWNSAPLHELCSHIVGKHHAYVREEFKQLTPMLAKVVLRHGSNHPELAAIQERWQELLQELSSHMEKEEHILFPFICSLEQADLDKSAVTASCFGTVQNPIRMMMLEHDHAADLLKQIRTLSIGYVAPADACTTYLGVMHGLEEFEHDLHLHVHLENNILFPRTVEMEQKVLTAA